MNIRLREFLFLFLLGHVYSLGWIFDQSLCNHDRNLDLDVSDVIIYIYDFPNNITGTFAINDAAQALLNYEYLDENRKIILFVGGFQNDINSEIEQHIRETYQNYPNSYLIIPDHSAYTNSNAGALLGYLRAVKYTYYIGKALGHMLADINTGGIDKNNIECVGHSLGAQMLGHTGLSFFYVTGTKIPRITGLDPAGPCFSKSSTINQLRSGVAEFVDIFHCNAGELGTTSYLGDVDFSANDGKIQPQCSSSVLSNVLDASEVASCSHDSCVSIWTASVRNLALFPAYKCDSYIKFSNDKCFGNNKTIAGYGNSGIATGSFYFSTQGYNLR